jgi:hypothetical protein
MFAGFKHNVGELVWHAADIFQPEALFTAQAPTMEAYLFHDDLNHRGFCNFVLYS